MDGEEMVFVEMADCLDRLVMDRVEACPDRIVVQYTANATCGVCDGSRSKLRAFSLPLDSRPVVATGKRIVPPCLP
jgi:hypothetical protein